MSDVAIAATAAANPPPPDVTQPPAIASAFLAGTVLRAALVRPPVSVSFWMCQYFSFVFDFSLVFSVSLSFGSEFQFQMLPGIPSVTVVMLSP